MEHGPRFSIATDSRQIKPCLARDAKRLQHTGHAVAHSSWKGRRIGIDDSTWGKGVVGLSLWDN